MGNRKRTHLAGVVACVMASIGGAATALAQDRPEGIAWDDRLFNPNPMPDDVILPMPCGGAMAFRRVLTPNTDGVIGDIPVILGQQGSDQPFLDGLRRSYVSGAFPAEDGTTRGLFYMAKYELTEAQYAVLAANGPDDCPSRIGRRQSIPKTEVSKARFDALAERYTLWLMQHAIEHLPMAGDTVGYLRLPTEEEWEFAARGGLAVSEAEFRAPRHPIADGGDLNEYIASGGSDSAGGEMGLIGTLNPNPLGLHDMLGNAWEIVGTPFALVRHGRLHGQAGGVVRRGGGVNWPLAEITSAQRFEMAPYNLRRLDVQTDRFTGGRFAISAISITSEAQNRELIEELDRMARPDETLPTAESEEEVRALLAGLRDNALTEQDRARLDVIRDTLDAATAERNQQRDEALRMILNSTVLICNQAVQRYLTARFAALSVFVELDDMEAEARMLGDDAYLAEVLNLRLQAEERLARLEQNLRGDVREYADLVEGMAARYTAENIRRQADHIQPGQDEGDDRRTACYNIMRTHLESRIAAGSSDLALLQSDFQSIARALASDD